MWTCAIQVISLLCNACIAIDNRANSVFVMVYEIMTYLLVEHFGFGKSNNSVSQVIIPGFADLGLLDSARRRRGGLRRRLRLWWSHTKRETTSIQSNHLTMFTGYLVLYLNVSLFSYKQVTLRLRFNFKVILRLL